ncbi:peptidoglycan hydrolase [Haladaptatus cibarius]|uniref:peptidoglycan hydrolase n=1 Tax=Haladaptatus cibarius TaxID=453847 RepID=UPI000678ACBF|nr:peptidoglycan-binding protein [Haladaptatus cibarius]
MANKNTRRNFLRTVGATALTIPALSATATAASDDFYWPTTGQVTSGYYDDRDGGTRTHRGVDIDWETGQPIYAAQSGTVTASGYNGGYGYRVNIEHEGGYRTRYAHCQSDLRVDVGDYVSRGEHIADLGGSGGYEPHLHFDIKRNGSYVYVPGSPGDWVDTSNPIPEDYPGLGDGGSGGYSWPVYSRGDNGEAVYSIQFLLEHHGYNLAHDGSYGPETESTVQNFQSAQGLTVDGVVGPNTWSNLVVYVTSSSDDPYWPTYAVQHQLNYDEGYNISVDGYYGPETEGAIESFQSSAGLTVDGMAGPNTWQALVDIGN